MHVRIIVVIFYGVHMGVLCQCGCVVSVWACRVGVGMLCQCGLILISYLISWGKLFLSGEDRYGCRLQVLCGDSSGCERHVLIIAASRCLVSDA